MSATNWVLHVVRHGETEWSRDRRHTGRTDLALTEAGRRQASGLRDALDPLHPTIVLSSPLQRARETAELAGFGTRLELDDRLVEWDYGHAEGLTTAEFRRTDPTWSVWTHPLDGGESVDDVGTRVDAVLADLLDRPAGDVLLFAHAHLLRIMAARWCGLPPAAGVHFVLDPAGRGALGFERDTRAVLAWNVAPGPMPS